MKVAALGGVLAWVTLATPAPVQQSEDFALAIISQEAKYNGSTVIPCEKGKRGPCEILVPT